MKKWIAASLMTFFFIGAGSLPSEAAVTADVKRTVDRVVSIVADENMKKPGNAAKRRAALKSAISTMFDYGEMAKRSLGVNWRGRTKAEQKDFVNLFATLLENSYAGKIESYENQRIVYDKESIDGDYAEVKSRIVTAKRDEYSLDYRLMRQGNRWMVYDVVIEGVSLVSNYRSQFQKIITSQGYGALVKKLRAKSDEIKAP